MHRFRRTVDTPYASYTVISNLPISPGLLQDIKGLHFQNPPSESAVYIQIIPKPRDDEVQILEHITGKQKNTQ